MGLWNAEPPQGHTSEQELLIIGRSPVPRFGAPQGSGQILIPPQPPTTMAYPFSTTEMAYPIEWLNLDYLQKIPFTVNAGKVPSIQTNFPLLINQTFPDLIGETKEEFAFAGIDGLPLPHQIVEFDSITGKLVARIQKPTISDNDIINMYYDNPTSTIPEQKVWDENYPAVYNLDPDVLDNIPDDTINGNDGVATTTTPNYEDAIVGKGFRSDTTEMISAPNSDSLDVGIGSFTIEAIVETFAAGNAVHGFIEKKTSANGFNKGFLFWLDFRTEVRGLALRLNDGTHSIDEIVEYGSGGRTALQNNGLHHIVGTYNSVTKLMSLYIDGVPGNTLTYAAGTGNFSNPAEDLRFLGTANLDALVDEVKISNITRSPDWIKTESNQLLDNVAFITAGAPQSPPPLTPMGYPQ